MQTWKLLKSVRVEDDEDLFVGEDVINLDPVEESASYDFDIETDPAYPGQFRVVSDGPIHHAIECCYVLLGLRDVLYLLADGTQD